MRIAFGILMVIHASIHLLGFIKGLNIYNIQTLTQPISKILGWVWFLAFVLFIVSFLLLVLKNQSWWVLALVAIVVSQTLIFIFWQDAKFGSVANLIILVSIIPAIGLNSFNAKLIKERASQKSTIENVPQNKLEDLPELVQNWLIKTGALEIDKITSVYLQQEALMKMKPTQKKWYEANAEQYFTTYPPSFVWSVKLKMNPLVNIVGRDKFEDGKGEMIIKLLGVFNIVNVKNNSKIDQSTLQRYLAETVWFPSAALSKYIIWEGIDAHSAKATMSYQGVSSSGIFFFNEKGEFEKFSAMRYMSPEKDVEPTEWIVEAINSQVLNGVLLPTELKATWKLKEGDWTWLKLKVTKLNYNVY